MLAEVDSVFPDMNEESRDGTWRRTKYLAESRLNREYSQILLS